MVLTQLSTSNKEATTTGGGRTGLALLAWRVDHGMAPCAQETTSLGIGFLRYGTSYGGERERGVSERLFLERLEKLGYEQPPQTPFPHARFGVCSITIASCDDEIRLWWTGGLALGVRELKYLFVKHGWSGIGIKCLVLEE